MGFSVLAESASKDIMLSMQEEIDRLLKRHAPGDIAEVVWTDIQETHDRHEIATYKVRLYIPESVDTDALLELFTRLQATKRRRQAPQSGRAVLVMPRQGDRRTGNARKWQHGEAYR